nr:hypothetical protein [Burkholderia sp. BCC1208]
MNGTTRTTRDAAQLIGRRGENPERRLNCPEDTEAALDSAGIALLPD